jgi:hypothetical protein
VVLVPLPPWKFACPPYYYCQKVTNYGSMLVFSGIMSVPVSVRIGPVHQKATGMDTQLCSACMVLLSHRLLSKGPFGSNKYTRKKIERDAIYKQ